MRKNSAVPPSHGGWPAWYDGKNINEVLFCEEFLAAHPMKCIRGRLFTVDGAVEDKPGIVPPGVGPVVPPTPLDENGKDEPESDPFDDIFKIFNRK